jgi:hypothetical protein
VLRIRAPNGGVARRQKKESCGGAAGGGALFVPPGQNPRLPVGSAENQIRAPTCPSGRALWSLADVARIAGLGTPGGGRTD